jgi:metal-responsive CopG/Arc/MetJ family transcriptional regulator
MVQRIGISMTDQELKKIGLLQKRLGSRSRSEFFRELVRLYEKLEGERTTLNACLNGYLRHPESDGAQSQSILKQSMAGHAFEDWS